VRLCNCGIYLDAIKEIKFRFDAIISVKTLAKLIIFVIHVLLYNRLKNGVLFSTSSASINPLGLYNYVPNGTQDYFIGQFFSAFQLGYIALIAYSSNLIIKKNIKFYILLFIFSFDEYRILYRLSRGEKNTQRLP
jgi:hypothetical protein